MDIGIAVIVGAMIGYIVNIYMTYKDIHKQRIAHDRYLKEYTNDQQDNFADLLKAIDVDHNEEEIKQILNTNFSNSTKWFSLSIKHHISTTNTTWNFDSNEWTYTKKYEL
jgi:hypothetical protein